MRNPSKDSMSTLGNTHNDTASTTRGTGNESVIEIGSTGRDTESPKRDSASSIGSIGRVSVRKSYGSPKRDSESSSSGGPGRSSGGPAGK